MKRLIFLVGALLLLTVELVFAQQGGDGARQAIELIEKQGDSIGAALLFADVVGTVPYAGNMPVGDADRFVNASLRFPEPGEYVLVIDFFTVWGIDMLRTTTGWMEDVTVAGACGRNSVRDDGSEARIHLDCPGEVSFVYRTNTHYVVVLVSYAPDSRG